MNTNTGTGSLNTGSNFCDKCGKPFTYIGDDIPGSKVKPWCTCGEIKDTGSVALTGWRCPVCGAGNSPFTSRCGCVPLELKVTC